MPVAYLLVSVAAMIRVIGPILLPLQYKLLIGLPAGLWIAAFSTFIWIYAPILILPRSDGKPG